MNALVAVLLHMCVQVVLVVNLRRLGVNLLVHLHLLRLLLLKGRLVLSGRLAPLQKPLNDVSVLLGATPVLEHFTYNRREVLKLVAEEHQAAVHGQAFDRVRVVARLAHSHNFALDDLNKLVQGVQRIAAVRQLLLHHV